ncbi:MAG: 2,3-diphosphoglycerate-dependent phosphoglycerate mutase, partial [Sphingomonadales bacterium]
ITELEIPTGQPIVYDFGDNLRPSGERYYLKDA